LVAAIVEPLVQAAVGLWIMPPGYLRGFARLCRKYAVPLIADEVATGFGRTGTMFAVQQEGVVPDFLCVAKSLTGGYLPLAATLTSDTIFRAFLGRYDQFKSFFHGHTYTANPLACAVALENLRLLQKKNWPRALAPLRRDLTLFLKEIGNHPRVGHVRQMGLMAGIELVADRKTGRRFPPGDRVGYRVCQAARKRGLWIRPLGDTLVILPPLGIGRVDLHRLTEAVRWALGEVLPPGDGTSFC
jgi:adenosylmethionine-8-amino-7-oxononanoate aminotransferase